MESDDIDAAVFHRKVRSPLVTHRSWKLDVGGGLELQRHSSHPQSMALRSSIVMLLTSNHAGKRPGLAVYHFWCRCSLQWRRRWER